MVIMALIRPRKFVYLYLTIFLLGLTWIIFSFAWCPSENEQHLEDLVSKYRDRLSVKEEEAKTMKERLKSVESRLEKMHIVKNIPGRSIHEFDKSIPVIYAITPTYKRLEQKAELTRLSQSLLHLANFHWIVVEDSQNKTSLVSNFLKKCGLSYTHLNVLTPVDFKLKQTDPNWVKPRGVLQRNAGLKWLRSNVNPDKQPGVVYFMDDDNTYDLEIFEEMRWTEKVSVWPVALVGALRYESPIVHNHKVTGWFTYWKPDRPFAMDMAGFAVNLKLYFQYPDAQFSNFVKRGYQESTILSAMQITLNDLEPLADNCTKILVWHTRTEKSKLKNEDRMRLKFGKGSDPDMEV